VCLRSRCCGDVDGRSLLAFNITVLPQVLSDTFTLHGSPYLGRRNSAGRTMAGNQLSAGSVGVFTTAYRIPLGSIEAPMQCVQEVLCEGKKVKYFDCVSLNRLSNIIRGTEFLSTSRSSASQ
jgi:hypothetical protein